MAQNDAPQLNMPQCPPGISIFGPQNSPNDQTQTAATVVNGHENPLGSHPAPPSYPPPPRPLVENRPTQHFPPLPQGASSQGADSQGANSQGANSQGTSTQPPGPQGTSSQGNQASSSSGPASLLPSNPADSSRKGSETPSGQGTSNTAANANSPRISTSSRSRSRAWAAGLSSSLKETFKILVCMIPLALDDEQEAEAEQPIELQQPAEPQQPPQQQQQSARAKGKTRAQTQVQQLDPVPEERRCLRECDICTVVWERCDCVDCSKTVSARVRRLLRFKTRTEVQRFCNCRPQDPRPPARLRPRSA